MSFCKCFIFNEKCVLILHKGCSEHKKQPFWKLKVKKYRGFTPFFPFRDPNLLPRRVTLSHSWVGSFALKTDGKTLSVYWSHGIRPNVEFGANRRRAVQNFWRFFAGWIWRGFKLCSWNSNSVSGWHMCPNCFFFAINWFCFVNIFYKLRK